MLFEIRTSQYRGRGGPAVPSAGDARWILDAPHVALLRAPDVLHLGPVQQGDAHGVFGLQESLQRSRPAAARSMPPCARVLVSPHQSIQQERLEMYGVR